MASDLSSETGPISIKRVTMDGTGGDATAITLPKWARKVTVVFKQSGGSDDSGKLAITGTDGATLGNDHFPVASGAALEWQVAPGRSRDTAGEVIYLAAATASAYAHLLIEG